MYARIPELSEPPCEMHPADFARLAANPDTATVAEQHESPLGSYLLAITVPFEVREGAWKCVRGVVLDRNGAAVLDIVRGYGTFPFAFITDCGGRMELLVVSAPDYTGTWVYDLEKPEKALVEGSRSGDAFCVGSYRPSPDGRHMVIDGCVWGGPYEYLVFNLESVRHGYLSCISTGDEMFVGDEDSIEWHEDEVVIRVKFDDAEVKWMEGMEYRVPLLKPLRFRHPEGCRCGECEV